MRTLVCCEYSFVSYSSLLQLSSKRAGIDVDVFFCVCFCHFRSQLNIKTFLSNPFTRTHACPRTSVSVCVSAHF